jgi:5-methylcytosine-specific restriction endonuclease McrA
MKRGFAHVPFSRTNVYARDGHRCQYCGRALPPSALTFDHVLPVARGGHKGWDNIVTCCIPCNRDKGDRTPEEAGFSLIRRPHRPRSVPMLARESGLLATPESWHDYLF